VLNPRSPARVADGAGAEQEQGGQEGAAEQRNGRARRQAHVDMKA
jgi:hypothetical protein